MTVATTTNVAVHTGNSVATEFPYSFKVLDADHLAVTRRVRATGEIDKTYIIDTEYTVDGIGAESGTVTILGAPLSASYDLILERIVPYTQALDIVNQGGFFPDAVEEQLDLSTMQVQQISNQIGRAVKAPAGGTGLTLSGLPDKVIGTNSDGELVELEAIDLASLVALTEAFSREGAKYFNPPTLLTGEQTTTTITISGIVPGDLVSGMSFDGSLRGVLLTGEVRSPNILTAVFSNVTGGTVDIESGVLRGRVVSHTSNPTLTFDGVFFDSTVDSFLARANYAPHVSLTVTDDDIAFSSTSAVSRYVQMNDPNGDLLKFCFDTYEFDATYTVTLTAGYTGFYSGSYNNATTSFASRLSNPFGANNTFLAELYANDALQATDASSGALAPGTVVRLRTSLAGNVLTMIANYNGGADRTFSRTMTLGNPVDSYELARLFNTPIFGRFLQGVVTCTAYKFTAAFPGARFGILGDSIEQGRFASVQSNGWAYRLRAAYPDDVMICGAPSATTANWLEATYAVCKMKPTHMWIKLGTNDVLLARPIADIKVDLTEVVDRVIAAGIHPIVCIPPACNSSLIYDLGEWIKLQGWDYVDFYAATVGVGYAMNVLFDSGDTIHPNDLGHDAMYDAAEAAILANGW